MNYINISICIDNDAFQDRLSEEVAAVLWPSLSDTQWQPDAPSVVSRLADGGCVKLQDTNGNSCGYAWTSDRSSHLKHNGGSI